MNQYVNLHAHIHRGSTLDSTILEPDYMSRAKELGMDYVAITDHGTMNGHRAFQRAAKDAGLTPILGLEAYITEDRFDKRSKAARTDGTSVYNHITILAKNENGLGTLQRLSEEAWRSGYYFKPRMDTDLLFSDKEDLIVLSGCLNGPLCKAIEAGDFAKAEAIALSYKEALGDNYYIELMAHNPVETNMALMTIADNNGIKLVSTADCHYTRKEDLWIEEAMLILSTKPKFAKDIDINKAKQMEFLERFNYLYPDRTMTFEQIEIYLKSAQEEMALYEKQDITRTDIFSNTLDIAQEIGTYPYHEALALLPRPDESPKTVLRRMVEAGLKEHGWENSKVHRERVEYELKIVSDKNFDVYFIIVADIIQWAKSQGIRIGFSRGSAGAFLINYLLKITGLDPLVWDLMPERFLSPDRNDWPDVDIDVQDNRRDEVINYVQQKYGYVAGISTEIVFDGKSAIRDAASVFRIPLSDVNRALKDNDAPPNQDGNYFDFFLTTPQGSEFNRKHPEVLRLARALSGRVRSRGIHPAGLVIAYDEINKWAPIETAKNPRDPDGPRIPVISYDMKEAEKIGLIKIDFLGLNTLSVIDDAVKFIERDYGIKVDTDALVSTPEVLDKEPAIYKMLAEGNTKGIFQAEAAPSTRVIKQVQVCNFDQLYATNALVRPGVSNSSFYQKYIDGSHGKVEYIHKDLIPVMKSTYGSMLFQEQLMKICTDLAGLTAGEADKVRKAVGKKIPADLAIWGPQFIAGAAEKIGDKKAQSLWKDIEASGAYLFNKVHSIGYSILSYQTAWLKYHYPLQFMAALIRNEKNKDRLTEYYIEAKRMGLTIYLPHVNKSKLETDVADEKDGIRMGLNSIKFISDKVGQKIMAKAPFANYEELEALSRTKYSGVNSRALNALDVVGAALFDDNPRKGNERESFYEYLGLPVSSTAVPFEVKEKITPIEWYNEDETSVIMGIMRGIKRGSGWALVDILDETGSAGVFADEKITLNPGQQYIFLVSNKRILRFMTVDELVSGEHNEFAAYLKGELDLPTDEGTYLSVAFRTHKTKAGKTMAYVVVADHMGRLYNMIVWANLYDRAFTRCRAGLKFKAQVSEKDEGSLVLEKFE